MAGETSLDAALRPFAPGPLIELSTEALRVQVAPQAGGRIAQITCDGLDWLCGYAPGNETAIGWGSYPMLPWAGRLRHGRFGFDGREVQLPLNLGAHAVHGIGFVLPWRVLAQSVATLEMSLQLPSDARWPFGGIAHQRIMLSGRSLRLELSLTAEEQAMPRPVLGWHPWFVKPERLDFLPTLCYPRDEQGIATRPLVEPPWGSPWDDCFVNSRPVELGRAGRMLRLSSDCNHWVVYDEHAHATCVEPQSGPPDVFNLNQAARLEAGATMSAWCLFEWLD